MFISLFKIYVFIYLLSSRPHCFIRSLKLKELLVPLSRLSLRLLSFSCKTIVVYGIENGCRRG